MNDWLKIFKLLTSADLFLTATSFENSNKTHLIYLKAFLLAMIKKNQEFIILEKKGNYLI